MRPEPPKVENAPGLVWKPRKEGWEARWQCRTDIIAKGFLPKSQRVWSGTTPNDTEAALISDSCTRLQNEMLVFARGGVPHLGNGMDGTLRTLINAYQTDPDSSYHKLRYQTRRHHDTLLRRLSQDYGGTALEDIKGRMLLAAHKVWSDNGKKLAVAHSFIAMLRTLSSFGLTILEDRECARIKEVLGNMRFESTRPRKERMTLEQAKAVIAKAHEFGWHSIARAQAFQFELMLRQKDVIGEWVPLSEPGVSDVIYRDRNKWLRGLRWEEISEDLTLTHVTSKKDKELVCDLKLSPLVMAELEFIGSHQRPKRGPVIVCEATARPFDAGEFRRKWRIVAKAAGVPAQVFNMDSRSGAISEATDAGAALEHVRHAATHSDIAMTQRYSRGSEQKVAEVMQLRVKHRNKTGNEGA